MWTRQSGFVATRRLHGPRRSRTSGAVREYVAALVRRVAPRRLASSGVDQLHLLLPGMGPMLATARVASVADHNTFRSGGNLLGLHRVAELRIVTEFGLSLTEFGQEHKRTV